MNLRKHEVNPTKYCMYLTLLDSVKLKTSLVLKEMDAVDFVFM